MLSHLEPLDESDGVRQGLVPGLHQPLPIPHRLDLLGLQRSHGTEERRIVGVAAEGLVVRLEGEGRLADSDRLVLGVPVGGVVAGEDGGRQMIIALGHFGRSFRKFREMRVRLSRSSENLREHKSDKTRSDFPGTGTDQNASRQFGSTSRLKPVRTPCLKR